MQRTRGGAFSVWPDDPRPGCGAGRCGRVARSSALGPRRCSR